MSTPGQSPTSTTAEMTLVVESESGTLQEYYVEQGANSNTIHIGHPDVDRLHARVPGAVEEGFKLKCEPEVVLR